MVDDKTGFAGMAVSYSPNVTAQESDGIVIGTQGNKAFFRLRDTGDLDRAVLQVADVGMSSFQVFEDGGKLVRDVLRSGTSK